LPQTEGVCFGLRREKPVVKTGQLQEMKGGKKEKMKTKNQQQVGVDDFIF
jgi:hypothetical protein